MSEDYEALKKIGIQKIHEDTHIAIVHIKAVMNEEYGAIDKVQFFGFLSILEREYSLNLDDLRVKAKEYFKEQNSNSTSENGVFIVPKKSKKFTQLYILLIIIAFVGVILLTLNFSSKDDKIEVQSVENVIIQKVKDDIKSAKVENSISELNSSSIDVNTTAVQKLKKEELEKVIPKEIVVKKELQPFKIIAKSKVWTGYIEVKTNKKYSKIVKDTLSLNRDKDWLVVLGHSHVTIEANGKKSSFSTNGQLRLLYKDGKVEKISLKEFKKLNRGRKW